MKTALRNFFVLSLAVLISAVMFPLGLGSTLLIAILTADLVRPYVYVSQAALSIALSLDLLGNVVCKDLMNHTLIKPGSYAFGNNRETISSVLGKNKATGSLTRAGKLLADLLNWIQPDHVERAAGL